MPDKGDIADWVDATPESTPEMLRRELESLVERAEPLGLPAMANSGRFVPFPTDLLPEPLRKLASAGAKSIGCEASYIALPALAVCAAVVGNKRRLLLKRDWIEPPILWSAIVGESGTQKTPAFSLVMKPLEAWQCQAMKKHEEDLATHKREMQSYELLKGKWKGSDGEGEPPDEPAPPTLPRTFVKDTTVEALAPLLRDNPNGLLLCVDELSGWFAAIERRRGRSWRPYPPDWP